MTSCTIHSLSVNLGNGRAQHHKSFCWEAVSLARTILYHCSLLCQKQFSQTMFPPKDLVSWGMNGEIRPIFSSELPINVVGSGFTVEKSQKKKKKLGFGFPTFYGWPKHISVTHKTENWAQDQEAQVLDLWALGASLSQLPSIVLGAPIWLSHINFIFLVR